MAAAAAALNIIIKGYGMRRRRYSPRPLSVMTPGPGDPGRWHMPSTKTAAAAATAQNSFLNYRRYSYCSERCATSLDNNTRVYDLFYNEYNTFIFYVLYGEVCGRRERNKMNTRLCVITPCTSSTRSVRTILS